MICPEIKMLPLKYPQVGEGEYGAMLIKPDSHILSLSEVIVSSLEEAGLRVDFRKELRITEEQIPQLYPDYVGDEDVYPAVVNLFNSGPSTILLLSKAEAGGKETIFSYVKRIKGKAREGGLRDRLILEYKEDLISRGLSGEDLNNELAKNRIHSPDNEQEYRDILRLGIDRLDLERISEYNEDLFNNINERLRIW